MTDSHARATTPADVDIDSIPGLVAILGPAGDVESVNQQVLEYCGQPLNAMRQWASNGILHPDDAPRIGPIFAAAIAAGSPYDFDARIRRVDRVYHWFSVRGRPLQNSGGTIARWYVLLTDIDARKRAEAMLAGEKELLEMVSRGASMPMVLDGICRLVENTAGDCRCSVVLVDSGRSRLEHGAAPSLPESYAASVVGRPVAPEEGPCATAVALNQQVLVPDLANDTRWTQTGWWPIALEHGLKSCWSTPIPAANGTALGTFAIYHDEPASPTTTQQVLIEQLTHIASIAIERTQEADALRRNEALLAKVQEISATGGFQWWPATGKGHWSEQIYRIFEIEPGTPMTPELRQSRIHPDDRQPLMEALEQVVREGRDFDYAVRLLLPDGMVKHLHLLMQATRDTHGELRYVGALQDVTSRHLYELALSKLRSELAHVARVTTLGVLTASITHEINQPLSGIITNASTCLRMLGANPPNVGGALETVRRTLRDGNRAAEVITRLRALYAGRETAVELVNLNEAAHEVVALSLGDLHRSRVIIRAELADDLPPVKGDRVQLQQVVLNLMRNATDALREVQDRPRDLLIRTQLDDDNSVRLSVRDAGMGFEPDVAEKLFDPFYTTKPDGMGMGLSVSRSIIEQHRGRIWATPNEECGATFAFSIPAESTA